MPFGLCNTPRTFQSYINSLLQEYLDIFCILYLDNILIYSKNNKKHIGQILKILKQMREKIFQLDINKYKFFIIEIKYFRLIVIIKNICIDPKKVQTIIDQESLILIKNIQTFLELAGFYQQFIATFLKKIVFLIKMMKKTHMTTKSGKNKVKYNLFEQIEDCKKNFQDLKQVFITALVFAHFDFELKT